MEEFVRPELIRMKIDPNYTEKWLQGIIASDPTILGLGDLEIISKERRQPKAGRLDLLLADQTTRTRFEVEIQLGSVDETHIIRTIEYWDIERKRYPHYEHRAVIIAEEITSRFLNVISLFNGHIPLIAMQVQALRIQGHVTLVFTRVLDEVSRAPLDEEEIQESVVDPTQWTKKHTPDVINLMNKLFEQIKEIDAKCEKNFTKSYLGVAVNKIANNFVMFFPQKKSLRVDIALPYVERYIDLVETTGFETLNYDQSFKLFRLLIRPGDLEGKPEKIVELKALFQAAYSERMG